jgi:hypothetical protein
MADPVTESFDDLKAQIASTIAERDRILLAMDEAAARAFVAKHGGRAPQNVNWTMVLHVARFECETIRRDHGTLWWDSRIWLAKNGAVSLGTTPERRECLVALDLVFPKSLTERYMAAMKGHRDA